jgi:transcriptional regulator with XRE-family HTH domain
MTSLGTQIPLVKSIGERIKALRTEQGMTLAELGGKANLSTSYLSQIERDKTTPSLSTLTLIAKALNVGLRYFFEAEAEAVYVVRAESQDEPALDSPITRQHMTPKVGNHKLEVSRVILGPHTSPEQLVPYPGEGVVFVLAGELNIVVGDEQFVLAAGDSIHYDALQPHCWSNTGDEPCVVIWGCATSRLER